MPSQYGPRVITDGLILCLDAADRNSYSGVGTNFNDICGRGNNTLLVNGPTYNNEYFGSIVLDGSKDYISGISSITLGDNTFTISMWLKYNAEPNNIQPRGKRKKIRFGRGQIHLEDDCDDIPRKLKFYIDDSTEQNLWSWGKNSFGQLGINNTTSKSTPVTVYNGGTEWEILTAGINYTGAIKDNGTIWMWGAAGSGQLGNNSGVQRITPINSVSGSNWKMISAQRSTSAAIKNDGTLWLWGYNLDAQLGINVGGGTRLTPVTTFAGGTNWNYVSAGYNNCAAIKNDGTLWLWGYNLYGQLGTNGGQNYRSTPVTTFVGGNNWRTVTCLMPDSMAAIKTDGTLWTWGRNDYGQLGINNVNDKSTPVTTILGGTNWKSVVSGYNYVAATKTDGTLWMWGRGQFGNLGTNDNVSRFTPVTTISGGTNWKTVSCSFYNNAAIKDDGTLWTWGYNPQGALGTNDTLSRSTPVTTILGGTTWKKVACGQDHTLAVKTNGTYLTDFKVDNSSITIGAIYNVVGVWNGNTMTLYRNNVVVGTYPVTGTVVKTPLDFTISSPIEAFNGNIYGVMVYDRSLSTSEIEQNYNALRPRFGI